MNQGTRNEFVRRMSVLTIAVIVAVMLSACAAPTAAPAPTEPPASAPQATAVPAAVPAATEAPAPAAGTGSGVSFGRDVKPVLETSCIRCHGGSDGTNAGLDLKSYASVMKGSENGAVVVAGDAANSALVKLISAGRMPKRAAKLPQEQIDLITRWVTEGAQNN